MTSVEEKRDAAMLLVFGDMDLDGDLIDETAPAQGKRQDIARETGMHAAAVERGATIPAGRLDPVPLFAIALGRDERAGRGDHVLARAQKAAKQVNVRDQPGEQNAIRIARDQRLGIVGGDDTGRRQADQRARILANLVGIGDVDPGEFDHRVLDEMPERGLANDAGGPLDDAIGLCGHGISPLGSGPVQTERI